MKRFISFFVLSLVCCGAFAGTQGRPAMSNKIMSAPERYTASVNQLNAMANVNGSIVPNNSVESLGTLEPVEPEIDRREAERNACINNNIGIGNTFVWASRFSDTSNYATMVEDVKNPENNVCFVRVELKSDDESRISVSDVRPKYFTWGEVIQCGSWVNENEMEDRILAAKKGNRVGSIVAGAVVGAGVGVGAMELFGNKLIGGKVQGQKALEEQQLYRSLLLTYKEKKDPQYDKIVAALKTMKEACGKDPSADYCEKYSSLIAEFGNK
jgi:hypothetical protein